MYAPARRQRLGEFPSVRLLSFCLCLRTPVTPEYPAKDSKTNPAKDSQSLPSTNALGVRWDCKKDVFCFSTRATAKTLKNLSKVLSQLALTYDPLQTVGPYLMTGKLLLQQFWRDLDDWKKPLTKEQQEGWMQWMTGLAEIEDLHVPRWYGFPKGTVITLSSCSDVGYRASVYFHAPGHDTAFVAAKGKVIGKKPSIPRSELQALVVSCHLAKTILKETEGVFAVGKVVFWVDSTAVYFWVKNYKEHYVPFVANRLAEVRDTFDELKQYQTEIHYVNTKQNPGDLLTRPRTVNDFKADFWFWIQGPDFLRGGEESWPAGPEVPKKEQDLELRKMFIVNATVTSDASIDDDVTTSSSLVEYAEKKGYVDVTAEQLHELEKKIVREAQQAAFAKDITELMALPELNDEGVLRSQIFTLGQLRKNEVFLDGEGLLRTVMRLDNAAFVSPDEKRPLLLPSKHPLTQLLVHKYHRQATHSGPKTTFALMARRYSLPLSAMKNVNYKCQQCRERMPIPVKYPQGALHENRLQALDVRLPQHGHGPLQASRSPASK